MTLFAMHVAKTSQKIAISKSIKRFMIKVPWQGEFKKEKNINAQNVLCATVASGVKGHCPPVNVHFEPEGPIPYPIVLNGRTTCSK